MTLNIIRDATPPVTLLRGRRAQYPFSDLNVGDAFDIDANGDVEATSKRLYASAYAHRRKRDSSFSFVIGVSPEHHGLVRLIRTA